MLRLLRIVGIVVFACIIGFAANSLWKMHETGELLERYNHAPKANLTLLVFSVILLSTLGYFEVTRVRRLSRRQRYGAAHYNEKTGSGIDGLDSSSIYAAPQTVDVWKGPRSRNSGRKHQRRSRSKQKPEAEAGAVWMRLLQLVCLFLPVAYLILLGLNLMQGHEDIWVTVLLPTVFGILFILSLVATVGIFGKKIWGMMIGYALAVCNLLIFPYGTAIGLILMMGLVGSSPIFEVSAAAERRKKARSKSASRAGLSAIQGG